MARPHASMVIVSEYDGREYCSGFVAVTEANRGTFIATQPGFIMGRKDRLKVCFFDKTELPASLFVFLDENELPESLFGTGPFCILRTAFHPQCKKIELMEGNVTPSPAIIFPPSSPTTFYHLPGFVSGESLEAYPISGTTTRMRTKDRFMAADGYFLVDCHYSEKTSDGDDRLAVAPVYAKKGGVMGMVVERCSGVKKVAMTSGGVKILIDMLMKQADKRKRYADDGSSKAEESAGNKRNRRRRGQFQGQ